MSKSYPFPPKDSIHWQHSNYSHDQASQVFDKDGTLAQFVNNNFASADDVDGLPPEHSMYWQGHTEKAPQAPEPVFPAPLDLTPATKPEQADAHFIPVRYAIDQMDDPNSVPLQQPFGLPSDWQGQGLLASRLESCHYTLRQLRDGWIYIYNKTTQTLNEYQLKGSQFSYFKPTPNENPDSERRGEEQPSKTYISYPKGNVLSLVFSTHRWTWIKYLEVLSNIKVHLQHMQTIILTDEQLTEHVGPISQLSQVADIEPSEVEDERFSLSFVMTQANDREDTGQDRTLMEL